MGTACRAVVAVESMASAAQSWQVRQLAWSEGKESSWGRDPLAVLAIIGQSSGIAAAVMLPCAALANSACAMRIAMPSDAHMRNGRRATNRINTIVRMKE